MDDQGTGTPPENSDVTNNAGQSEVERLRKEAEQAKMRANQLANELEERKKAEAEAEEAKLKENEQYKTLFEQSEAKRKELEESSQAERRAAEVEAASKELSKDFSRDVLDLAATAGVTLTDVSDEAKANYTERLNGIAAKLRPGSSPVRGSNPAPPQEQTSDQSKLMTEMKVGSVTSPDMLNRAVHEYLKDNKDLERMREMAGYRRPSA
jgi:hypothetical protein